MGAAVLAGKAPTHATAAGGSPDVKAFVQNLLMHPPGSPEGELQDLREEVEDLRAEVRRLRRGLSELRQLVENRSDSRVSDSRPASGHPGKERATTYSGYSGSSSSPDREGRALVAEAAPAQQSLPVASVSPTTAPSPMSLTWLQREQICDEIGRFLARSIAGSFRGPSGRDKINLPSRIWIIVRDYAGQIHSPVKVVRNWTSCKVLVKPSNHECGDSVFVGLPSEREARRVVAAAELDWPAVVEQ